MEHIPMLGYLVLHEGVSFNGDNLPLQSFIRTIPKICSSAFSTVIRSPSSFPTPTTNAISSSKSSFCDGPKDGGPSFGLICPHGRLTAVPDMNTDDDRP